MKKKLTTNEYNKLAKDLGDLRIELDSLEDNSSEYAESLARQISDIELGFENHRNLIGNELCDMLLSGESI